MTRRFFLWLGKAALAGLLAFALLCFFCLLYYNVPVHDVNPTGATEYKWEPGRFYSRGTEGFAMGRTNSDGFNNLFDYAPGDPIDILLMGSSHMEGFNVAQGKKPSTTSAPPATRCSTASSTWTRRWTPTPPASTSCWRP